jgi:GT2 family glycosyltransferase
MPDIGIVIVTYNSRAEIAACLQAAISSGAEVVVVDNASSDGTPEEVRRFGVRLLANTNNRGFAAAVNQGFAALATPFVLLLNPDAQLEAGLDPMVAACRLPRVAGVGGKLLDPDGHPQVGFMFRQLPGPAVLILEILLLNRIWPNNPVNRRYRGLQVNYNMRIPVEQPAGAFLMVPRAVWQELGGFDESFFPLWFEDVDFCRRAIDRGYQFFYVPEAVAQHRGGHSISQLSVEKRRVYWYGSLLRYSAKHFRPPAFRAVCLATVAGSLLRSFGETVLQGSFKPLAAYWKVVRHASRCFLFGWGDDAATRVPE